MAVVGIDITLGADLGEGRYNSSSKPASADPVVGAAAADTAVGVVVTDIDTAFTAQDVFGAALVAITGDSYSAVTHLWTTGGATGLTHAQVVTLMALFNTASADFVIAKTDTATAKVLTAAVSGGATAGNCVVSIDTAVITTKNALKAVFKKAYEFLEGSAIQS